jgi:YD repeat-containing protein
MTKSFLFIVLIASVILISQLWPPSEPATAGVPGTMTYQYDSLGRLVGDVNSSGNSGAYSYDAAGNRLTSSIN